MDLNDVETLDLTDPATAVETWRAQLAAYEVEADLIGYHGIPPLHESLEEMMSQALHWIGSRDDSGTVVAALGFTEDQGCIDIDRLFVAPGSIRNGRARALVAALATDREVTVSAACANQPAIRLYESLGFVRVREEEIVGGLSIVHFRREAA